MVQGEQAVEDSASCAFGDGIADALLGLVEAVTQVEVGPAICDGDGVVHLYDKLTESLDTRFLHIQAVQISAGGCQSLLSRHHQALAVFEVSMTYSD